MERTSVNGVELAHEEVGDGPAVVLVHGLGGSAYAWRAQLGALGARYRAIALDQRGAGRSAKPPGPYSIELWVDDLIALLDSLGVEHVALAGHSAGCMIVERATVALGDRVWALAMCGGRLAWPPEAKRVFEQRAELARAGRMDDVAEAVTAGALSERCRRDNPVLEGLMLELIASSDPGAYAAWALAVSEAEMADPGSVRCPALAFAGSEDVVTPPDAAAEIAAAMPACETATIADAAHWCMLEQPAAVSDTLLAFLRTHTPKS